MSNIELTEPQIQVYNAVKSHGDEPISKKQIAKELDAQVRQISPATKALESAGIFVLDEYGEYLLAAGIKENGDGTLSIPTPSAAPTTTPSISGQGKEDEPLDESDNPNSEYFSLHPEELVTYYQEEGMDILKRNALEQALLHTAGVGKKGLETVLHWYDIDVDVRRDPTMLMRSLEDAGVKHNIVGRIARETFLPEKQFGRYLKPESDVIIDRGRPAQGRRDIMINQQPYDGYGYPNQNQWPPGQGQGQQQPPLSHRNKYEMQGPPDMAGGQPPWWYNQIMTRLDNLDNTQGQGQGRGRNSEPEDSRVVIEPVLDEHGQPVEDPNNPGNYLVRKIIHEGGRQVTPAQGYPGQPEPEHVKLMREQLNEQKEELKTFRKVFEDQETERKIYGAITEATAPLVQKINSLEKQPVVMAGDMTDERYKLVTEKEIFQDMTGSVKEIMTDVLEPVVMGVQEMQKMAGMREVIDMEKSDGVPSGTYLKYMMSGNTPEEPITKDRISGTINKIKKTNK